MLKSVLNSSLKLTIGVTACSLLFGAFSTSISAKDYGLGRVALEEEIAAWDIDVRPDGLGLPAGQGTAAEGEEVFAELCAACHGDFGEGIDRWPVLAGGFDTLDTEDPVKTVGSYWPYVSTIYDYIYRAMPFGEAQSLSADEVYSITAYLLAMNDLLDDWDHVLNQDNLTDIRLPNEANFIIDPLPDTPTLQVQEVCMQNCKTDVKITSRARILDVTPEEEFLSDSAVD